MRRCDGTATLCVTVILRTPIFGITTRKGRDISLNIYIQTPMQQHIYMNLHVYTYTSINACTCSQIHAIGDQTFLTGCRPSCAGLPCAGQMEPQQSQGKKHHRHRCTYSLSEYTRLSYLRDFKLWISAQFICDGPCRQELAFLFQRAGQSPRSPQVRSSRFQVLEMA